MNDEKRMSEDALDSFTMHGNTAQVAREARRARAEESRKDIRIGALAEALKMQGSTERGRDDEWHTATCGRCFVPSKPACTPDCVAARTALRLAGR